MHLSALARQGLPLIITYPILFRDIYDRSSAACSAHTPVISGGWPIGVRQSFASHNNMARSRPEPRSSASEALFQWLTALKVPFPLNRLPFRDLSLGSLPIEETAISDAYSRTDARPYVRDRRRRHSSAPSTGLKYAHSILTQR